MDTLVNYTCKSFIKLTPALQTQSVPKSVSQLVAVSQFSQSFSQFLNQSFCQSVRYPAAQSVIQLVAQSVILSDDQKPNCTVSQSVSQSVAQSVILSAGQEPNCTVSQSVAQSLILSASQVPNCTVTGESVNCSISQCLGTVSCSFNQLYL